MDLFEAIKGRRSCRNFSSDPMPDADLGKILEAGTWAPSPLNAQPWEFIAISNQGVKDKIFSEAERCRLWAIEKSGWKWLGKYQLDFLKSAPLIIAVIGDPEKSGVDMFQEEGRMGYQHACAAAVQNIHLAAHALGYATLWFTLFDKKVVREILGVPQEKVPLAVVCLGKAGSEIPPVPRKDVTGKIRYIR